MIKITLYKKGQDDYTGFLISGHAGSAESGKDIVCAGVSALVINTINSLEELTADDFIVDTDEKTGTMELRFLSDYSNEARLLMNSLILGLKGIRNSNNKKYIRIVYKEV